MIRSEDRKWIRSEVYQRICSIIRLVMKTSDVLKIIIWFGNQS